MFRTGNQTGSANAVLTNFLDASCNELENAWLWFAERATSDEARRYCFERALRANPESVLAQQGLVWLCQKQVAAQPGISNLRRHLQTGAHIVARLSNSLRERNSNFVVE